MCVFRAVNAVRGFIFKPHSNKRQPAPIHPTRTRSVNAVRRTVPVGTNACVCVCVLQQPSSTIGRRSFASRNVGITSGPRNARRRAAGHGRIMAPGTGGFCKCNDCCTVCAMHPLRQCGRVCSHDRCVIGLTLPPPRQALHTRTALTPLYRCCWDGTPPERTEPTRKSFKNKSPKFLQRSIGGGWRYFGTRWQKG